MSELKKIRKAKGLTQKKLAELVGTSQQQIQRLETGASLPALKLGLAIAGVLNSPLHLLFPSSLDTVQSVRQRIAISKSFTDEDLDEAAAAGIELDTTLWDFKALLPGRPDPLIIEIDPRERRRLLRNLLLEERAGFNDFMLVKGRSEVFLLNKKQLDHVEFLEDRMPPGAVIPETVVPDDAPCLGNLLIEFISGATHSIPVWNQVIYSRSQQDEIGELMELVTELEDGGIEERSRVVLRDSDGEDCVLRPASIRLIESPRVH